MLLCCGHVSSYFQYGRWCHLVTEITFPRFDFSKTYGQAMAVHSVRLIFLALVFSITILFQFLESRIDAFEFFYPLYLLMACSFGLQLFYFIFFKYLFRDHWVNGFLFAFEAFYVTGLIYFIGIQQSLLVFLYLVNLMLCGIFFQRRGALLLALWTSVLFSFIVSLDTSISGNTAYLAVGVNNLAFFTVAYLAGFLSEQLNLMGAQLKEKTKDVQVLQNLNDLILNSISSGLVTVDGESRILQINPAARRILGLNSEGLKYHPLSEVMPGLEPEQKENGEEFDFSFKRQGEKRILSLSYSSLKDDLNREQGRIITFRDETQMRTLEKRVRQSEKMAAIGQLATGIAHEIRNPLAGISGSIQLMQSDSSDPVQTGKLMGIVIKEIDRLNNLITEFLDFAKPEAPMEDRFDLGRLMEELIQFTQNANHGANVELELNADSDLFMLGNKDKIKQAVLNILVNALHAVEGVDSPKVEVQVKRSGPFIVLSIVDNGVGMNADLVDTIFEPFKTTKHKGTGLGLAITHSIVEAHRGDIIVESEVGRGTEFRLQFQAINL